MTQLKPRLELRIGITGHRPPRLKTEVIERVATQLREVLAAILAELRQVKEDHHVFYSDEPARLVLVSPLAAGSDSIAADAALAVGAELEACLPFSRERYRQDFDEAELVVFNRLLALAKRVLSLHGDDLPVNDAYRAIGSLTLAQSDLLIAIWDGQPAAGTGGTPEVVAEAVAEHTPVIVIDAKGREDPKLLWSNLDTEPHDMPTIETVASRHAHAVLEPLVRALTLPPLGDSPGLASFMAERKRRPSPSYGYPMLLWITGARTWSAAFRPPTAQGSAEQIEPMLAAFAPGTDAAYDVQGLMIPRFAAADLAANDFALKYRGGFISNFVMSALAVFCALAGLLVPDLKVVFVILELLVIFSIIGRTSLAGRARWHRRWIDTRHLAELLRVLTLSSALGNLSLRPRGDQVQPAGWPGWYAQATAREVGMAPVHLSVEHVGLIRDSALRMIDEQRGYHRNNAHRMEKVDHWLRHVGDGLLAGTILSCIGWFIAKLTLGAHPEVMGLSITSLVTFLTALLPAVGASLYGIRMQGDFAHAAERSMSIGRQLDRLRLAIERDPLDHRRLSGRLRRLSEIMMSEIDQWRQMSEVRPLELPG